VLGKYLKKGKEKRKDIYIYVEDRNRIDGDTFFGQY
jgi:hypothetical protein